MKHKREHRDLIFELTAPAGSEFTRFRVNRWGSPEGLVTYLGQKDTRKNKTVRLIVKVVGLIDSKSPQRNWGKFSRTQQ